MKIAFKKLHGQLVPFTDKDYESLKKLKDGAVYEVDIKELLWRPVMKQQTNKSSTTKLSKDEVSQVYDTLNRALSQRCGVSVEFPNREE